MFCDVDTYTIHICSAISKFPPFGGRGAAWCWICRTPADGQDQSGSIDHEESGAPEIGGATGHWMGIHDRTTGAHNDTRDFWKMGMGFDQGKDV